MNRRESDMWADAEAKAAERTRLAQASARAQAAKRRRNKIIEGQVKCTCNSTCPVHDKS